MKNKVLHKIILKGNGVYFALHIMISMINCFVGIGIALMLNYIIDVIATGDMEKLIQAAIFSVIFAFAVAVITLLYRYISSTFYKKAMCNIKSKLVDGIMCKSISEFQKENSGSFISLLNNDMASIETNYVQMWFELFETVVTIIAAVITLFYFHWIAAIIALVLGVIPILIPGLFAKKMSRAQEKISETSADYNEKIKDIFSGFEVIKSYSIENRIHENHNKALEKMEQAKQKQGFLLGRLYGVVNLVSVTVQYSLMILSGLLVFGGLLTIGNIIALTQLSGQALSPAFELSQRIAQLKSVQPIIDKMKKMFLAEHIASLPINTVSFEKSISFCDVSFSYGNEKQALNHISYTFEKGKKYAIVGGSGSGKTTLIKLLLKYYQEYDGKIRLDERDYLNFNSAEINKICAYIHQNVFLFDDTLKNNITLYDCHKDSLVVEALGNAGLADFVQSLPNGMESLVGENGGLFSGGEKQRIAIARAFLKNTSVFVLDEATSALDNENAYLIENVILNKKETTAFVITHKLNENVLKRYDEILVMRNGSIVESGNFDTLMNQKEYFYSLYTVGSME